MRNKNNTGDFPKCHVGQNIYGGERIINEWQEFES